MMRRSPLFVFIALVSLAMTSQALAFGEDVLAHTGQYTFFIKPEPTSCITYYQKMVPCVAEETIPVPKRVAPVYPFPVPVGQRQQVLVSERPVGCAEGAGPCVQCFPKDMKRTFSRDVPVPRMVPVRIPGIDIVPVTVTRPVMRLQWFEVTESPLPPRPIGKVRMGG
jgi:hypothetical protein